MRKGLAEAGRADRLGGLAALQRQMAASTDLQALMDVIAAQLGALLSVADRVSLAFVEPGGEFMRFYRLLPPARLSDSLPRVRVDGTVVGRVAREGRSCLVSDVRSDPGITFGHASHEGIRSTASVPVRVGGRVVGVMNTGSRQVGACHAGVLTELQEIADVVGPAVYAGERLFGLPAAGPAEDDAPSGLVGASPSFSRLLQRARRAAASDATVLITGETGVGKTALARAIHGWSARGRRDFVAVHLADLPPTLVEAELFGHERGAFTGAEQRRTGRFEAAHRGTIFLDEIGESPLAVQSKLLRVVQDGAFERVGGNATITSDVRVIAATNRDLREAVAAGQFREDLLYRLEIVPLHIPPLRERPEDLEAITRALLARLSVEHRRSLSLSPDAWARLRGHAWRGNVRELEAVLLRAVVLEEDDELRLDLFEASGRAPAPPVSDWPTRDEHERRYLRRVIEHTGGQIEGAQGAAKILGMQPSTLRSRMKRLGVSADAVRRAGER